MKKMIIGIFTIIAVVAVVMMYGGYIEEEILIPQINPPSFVSDTKCLYVELNHWEKVGENEVRQVGRDNICYPNVIEKNIIYDSKGVAEITVVTKEGTITVKRTSPTENQSRFMTIGEIIEFDTCEECGAFYGKRE